MKQLAQQLNEALLGGKNLRHTSIDADANKTFYDLETGDDIYVYMSDSDNIKTPIRFKKWKVNTYNKESGHLWYGNFHTEIDPEMIRKCQIIIYVHLQNGWIRVLCASKDAAKRAEKIDLNPKNLDKNYFTTMKYPDNWTTYYVL